MHAIRNQPSGCLGVGVRGMGGGGLRGGLEVFLYLGAGWIGLFSLQKFSQLYYNNCTFLYVQYTSLKKYFKEWV